MATNKRFTSTLKKERRWAGKTFTGQSKYTKRYFMDIKNRCAMERLTGSISTIPDMPPSIPILGRNRDFQKNFNCFSHGFRRTRQNQPYGSIYRWFFCKSQKRGSEIGKTKAGKGSKIMAITDSSGLPVAINVGSASPHEIILVEPTIDQLWTENYPSRLIGDKAYDSDPLDERLSKERHIDLIAPHKENRKQKSTQDGRILRRYCRRYKIERFFAWLQNFRRIVTRYEYHIQNYIAMVLLGCIVILLRQFLR
jgi:transposase